MAYTASSAAFASESTVAAMELGSARPCRLAHDIHGPVANGAVTSGTQIHAALDDYNAHGTIGASLWANDGDLF